ncbi:MAG: DNA adenine methylase [Candidatus Marinimicrobia bacterium CG08_land_8_20_14_0_20_45_22]|nr:MAG: DNA adenine methylase [Candidatus Marinimicrobia bacterium CG08_land_8_20_14_0_20_45_22]
MRIIVPPIKSQGIKTKLVPWIQLLVPEVKGRWIEPFFGTGVVAFNSGFQKALLNDINPHIIRFYQAIKDRKITPESVREYLERESKLLAEADDKGYAHFRFIKDRFNEQHAPLDFLFLSRAGFNGMMRFNKKGKWNIPFCQKPERFSKSYITKIVNQVNKVACLIQLEWIFTAEPFEQTILKAGPDDIIYCDPPYIGRYVDYFSGWNEENELRLFGLLSETPARFILSTWHHNDYRSNPFINSLWNRFNIITRDHFYHGGGKIENRKSIVEALVFNYEANVEKHNAYVQPKAEQMILFEQRVEYIEKKLKREF